MTFDDARARARAILGEAAHDGGRVGVVYHADADGISAAALACATVERRGGAVIALTPPKGKNVYDDAFRAELERVEARAVLVLDTGSRAGARYGPLPTIVVDHHVAEAPPDVAAFVHDVRAISTSLLALDLLAPLARLDDRAWLAAIGALGDRGDDARSEPAVGDAVVRFGRTSLDRVVALVNAAGRAADPRPDVALEALRRADDPRTIVRGDSSAARRLHEMRAEVAEASRRARRAPPRIRGRWAVIEIDEACRVHGIVASSWARRLAPRIVLVANTGYMPGRVHVSVRSSEDIDLRAAMRALLPAEGDDYAAGHTRATGAILTVAAYARLIGAIDAEGARAREAGQRAP